MPLSISVGLLMCDFNSLLFHIIINGEEHRIITTQYIFQVLHQQCDEMGCLFKNKQAAFLMAHFLELDP